MYPASLRRETVHGLMILIKCLFHPRHHRIGDAKGGRVYVIMEETHLADYIASSLDAALGSIESELEGTSLSVITPQTCQ